MKRIPITDVRKIMAELIRQQETVIVTQNDIPSAILLPINAEASEERERVAQAFEFNPQAGIKEVL
jgi:antitoxin (DNA-binding transcriptional repressor) of toxin-antitoxin stability system